MKKLAILFILLPFISACTPPPASINVNPDTFKSRQWTIAVIDLGYKPVDPGTTGIVAYQSAGDDAGQVVASLLATELSRLDNIRIVERGRIESVIDEQKLQQSGIINNTTAVEIGEILGADAVILGDVTDYIAWSSTVVVGSTVSFSIRMVDVNNGQVISSGSASKVENFVVAFQNAQNLARQLVDELIAKLD